MIFCDPIFLITKIYVSPLACCLSASSFHEQRTSCITQTLKHLQCLLGLALQLGAWRGWFPKDCLPELVNNMPNHNSGTVTFWPTRQRAIHHEHEHEHMCTYVYMIAVSDRAVWLQRFTNVHVRNHSHHSSICNLCKGSIPQASAYFSQARRLTALPCSLPICSRNLRTGFELVQVYLNKLWKKDKERHPVPLTWEICVGQRDIYACQVSMAGNELCHKCCASAWMATDSSDFINHKYIVYSIY